MNRGMRPTIVAGWFGLRKIYREGRRLYLKRWAIRPQYQSGFNAWRMYLHRFISPDGIGHHNHPWTWSFSIVLWGSYTEEYFDGPGPHSSREFCHRVRTRRVRWFNWIPSMRYHRITELHGTCWTLFFCGPKLPSGWGFWIPGRGHVDQAIVKKEMNL